MFVCAGVVCGNAQIVDPNVEKPAYSGGKEKLCEYIVKHTKYPKVAIDSNITGRVFVMFKITEKGYVTDVKIIKGPSPLLDSAAVQVIRTMPRWKPALMNGKPIASMGNIPINFQISDSGKPDISQCRTYGK